MATDSISATTTANPLSNLDQQSRMPVTTLDQNDFLKLLVTQMTTQDPMKPMDDLSSFSQLASFSALEQNKATQSSMAMIQANSMIGDYVTVTDQQGNTTVGQVSQVQMIDSKPTLIIGGQRYNLDQVTAVSISPFELANNPPTSSSVPGDSGSTPTTPQLGAPPTLGEPITGSVPTLDNPAILGNVPTL